MEFGKVKDVSSIDFTMPPEPPFNARWSAAPDPALKLRIGTAQWGDRGLARRLFPPGTPPRQYLERYAACFETIELNSTFYGTSREQLAGWAARVPDGFRFCAKFPREVSHDGPLDADGPAARAFADALGALQGKAGPAWLLPPADLGPARGAELWRFCERWRRISPLAVELRHPQWFRNRGAIDDWAQRLLDLDTIAMITDVAGRRDVLHLRRTAATGMVRFVGNSKHPSDFARLEDWLERLAHWRAGGLREAYLFLHQPSEDLNADVARWAIARANDRLDADLHVPARARAEQARLF